MVIYEREMLISYCPTCGQPCDQLTTYKSHIKIDVELLVDKGKKKGKAYNKFISNKVKRSKK